MELLRVDYFYFFLACIFEFRDVDVFKKQLWILQNVYW